MTKETRLNLLVVSFLVLELALLFSFALFYYLPFAAPVTGVLFLVIWYTFFYYFEKWK